MRTEGNSVPPHSELSNQVKYVPQESHILMGGTIRVTGQRLCSSTAAEGTLTRREGGRSGLFYSSLHSFTSQPCNCLKANRKAKVESRGHVFVFVSLRVTFVFHQFILLEEKHSVFCANRPSRQDASRCSSALITVMERVMKNAHHLLELEAGAGGSQSVIGTTDPSICLPEILITIWESEQSSLVRCWFANTHNLQINQTQSEAVSVSSWCNLLLCLCLTNMLIYMNFRFYAVFSVSATRTYHLYSCCCNFLLIFSWFSCFPVQ